MSLSANLVIGLTVLIPIALLLLISHTHWGKRIGQRLKVTVRLTHRIKHSSKRLLHDVELLTPTCSERIDHLLIVPTGVFIIDRLPLHGQLSGNPTHGQWRQQYRSTRRIIQNPMHQNFKRLLAVQDVINSTHTTPFTVETFQSLIVLTGNAQFTHDAPDNVQMSRSFTDYINQFDVELLNSDQVNSIAEAIETYRLGKTAAEPTKPEHKCIGQQRKKRLTHKK
ncbi:MAG: nuclease-related domain-containing protein [Pseudomonadota bacterium]